MDRRPVSDILFKKNDMMFSYRVAGILKDGHHVLLQHDEDKVYAFPGGHVGFFEDPKDCLIREFEEEMAVQIQVKRLMWVGHIHFMWDKDTPCHQICLFYEIEADSKDLMRIRKNHIDSIDGSGMTIDFAWIDIDQFDAIEVYPIKAKTLIKESHDQVVEFSERSVGR